MIPLASGADAHAPEPRSATWKGHTGGVGLQGTAQSVSSHPNIMKRPTDVSRLRPAFQESPETGMPSASCNAAVERATALLIRGMQQSDNPIAELSSALA